MTLENLNKDMVTAWKSGDKNRKDVLTSLVGAVKKAAIDKKTDRENVPENIVDEVLLKEQKTVKEMIETCPDSRTDLLNQYNYILSVINEYAPCLVNDEDEVRKIINNYLTEQFNNAVFAKNQVKEKRGGLMKYLKGKVDLSVASKVVAQMLAE